MHCVILFTFWLYLGLRQFRFYFRFDFKLNPIFKLISDLIQKKNGDFKLSVLFIYIIAILYCYYEIMMNLAINSMDVHTVSMVLPVI